MTIISSSGEAAGENALYAEECGGLCASLAGSLCRDRFEGTLEKHSSEKEGRMKNEGFFMRPLLWRPYSRQYSPEDIFWGLRMHFVVAESS